MRYAVYFVPADNSGLGVFGARLFGRWPDASIERNTLDIDDREARTSRVARYGFHATLKAPFELAAGCSEQGLADAIAELATRMRPVRFGPMTVHADASGVFLSHAADVDARTIEAIQTIAERCVVDLEPWRAPLSEAAHARRKPAQLNARERELLETYGYPWVLEAFQFHITLGDCFGDVRDQAWVDALGEQFRTLVTAPPVFDRIALCRELASDRSGDLSSVSTSETDQVTGANSSEARVMARVAEFRLGADPKAARQ